MAKIIKCPKCGENVEIPPNAAGTVVKCAACGTGLRIKARPAQAGGGEQDRSHGSMSGSKSGSISGSLAGTVIGQTGYGQPPPQESDPDGPPSLGSECAVCGRSVDPDDLIEDRGKLVCSKCAKRPSRAAGAAGGLAVPQYPTGASFEPALRHGPMITFNGAFLAGCGALLIAGAAQAFLYFNPKPQGTRAIVATPTAVRSATKPAVRTVPTWEDENRADVVKRLGEAAALAESDPNGAVAKYNEVLTLVSDKRIDDESLRAMLDKARTDRDNLEKTLLAEKPTETPTPGPATQIAMDKPTPTREVKPPDTAPPDTEPAPGPPKPQNIFELPPDTPEVLAPVLMALSKKNYTEAAEAAKNVRPSNVPNRDQRLTLETLGAVNLGIGRFDLAEGQLRRASEAYASAGAKPTRSVVLNRAMAQLARRNPPPQNVAKDLQAFLSQHGAPPDETTHAILGTAVSRIDPKVKEREELVNFLNSYTQQLDGTRAGDGKRRWGVSWADAEKVAAAEQYVNEVNEQIKKLEPELDKYFTQRQNAAVLGTKENVAKAEANYQRVYGEIHQRKQALLPYQPKWLEKFEPVMPEVEEESAAPPPPIDAPDAPPPPPSSPEPAQPAEPQAPAPAPPPPPVP